MCKIRETSVSYTMNSKTKEQFESLYNELSEPVFRHCFFRLHNREKALEITQDTFTKTWDYLVKGGEIQNKKAFLYRTATNLIINEITRTKELVSLDLMQEETGFDIAVDTSSETIDKIEGALLIEKLEKIGSVYKDILFMRYIDELSVAEIAEITGQSAGNVSVRLHRGIKELKKIYEGNN